MPHASFPFIIIFALIIGVFLQIKDDYQSRPIGMNQSHFTQKYLNKSFTKSDLVNSSIFNLNELLNYFHDNYIRCDLFHGMMHKLITTGINIVNDNNNLTLQLHDEFDSCQTFIYIYDTKHNCNNEINYVHKKTLGYEISVRNICQNKMYKFSDRSSVELYFVLEKNRMIILELYSLLKNISSNN